MDTTYIGSLDLYSNELQRIHFYDSVNPKESDNLNFLPIYKPINNYIYEKENSQPLDNKQNIDYDFKEKLQRVK